MDQEFLTAFTRCLAAAPTLVTLELILPHYGRLSVERYQALENADILLPQLRNLARPTLAHTELRMWSWHAFVRRNVPPPMPHIEAQFAALADGEMDG
ncbi:hypothetical protein B0H19DRAFT_1255121 [Mycena capillaripes]|nr:hypothetical protein B0H19DRAFT_1255121 [Mycena capillaripes]